MVVELKNDVALRGTLHSVDQFLNVKLNNVTVVDRERYPQLVRARNVCASAAVPWSSGLLCVALSHLLPRARQIPIKNCFIRGSVVRYVQIPAAEVDTELLQDATRREAGQATTK